MPWDTLISLTTVAFLLLLGLAVGRTRELRHLADLTRREQESAGILVNNLRHPHSPETVDRVVLVSGDVVIGSDYLKTFLSAYRKLVGGEMRSYERLVQRARREATLRMIEQARSLGAREVWNVRLDTANIGGLQTKGGVMCEAFAYGTAVIRRS